MSYFPDPCTLAFVSVHLKEQTLPIFTGWFLQAKPSAMSLDWWDCLCGHDWAWLEPGHVAAIRSGVWSHWWRCSLGTCTGMISAGFLKDRTATKWGLSWVTEQLPSPLSGLRSSGLLPGAWKAMASIMILGVQYCLQILIGQSWSCITWWLPSLELGPIGMAVTGGTDRCGSSRSETGLFIAPKSSPTVFQ